MPHTGDLYHSVLLVSASGQLLAIVRRIFSGFHTVESAGSASAARRCLLEKYYDLIVVDGPLPDETGEALAVDAAEESNASVLLMLPQNIFEETLERVTDHGILMLPKPTTRGRIAQAIRFLLALQRKLHTMERKVRAAEDRLEEQRVVSRAKFLLMEQRHMTEDEAHRLIGKNAMDNGISRGKAARYILDDLE